MGGITYSSHDKRAVNRQRRAWNGPRSAFRFGITSIVICACINYEHIAEQWTYGAGSSSGVYISRVSSKKDTVIVSYFVAKQWSNTRFAQQGKWNVERVRCPFPKTRMAGAGPGPYVGARRFSLNDVKAETVRDSNLEDQDDLLRCVIRKQLYFNL